MSRLIDADALKENVPNTNVDIFENCRNCSTLMDWQVKELIDQMPTIDAVEVVRCFECKYFREHEQEYKDRWGSDWDGYCTYWNSHSTVFSNFCGFAQKMDGEEKNDE